MIEDKGNCRYVYFGHGTVGLVKSMDKTGEIFIEKAPEPVGTYTKQHSPGDDAEKLPEKSVVLVFDNANAKQSIDMLIEDLLQIREAQFGAEKSVGEHDVPNTLLNLCRINLLVEKYRKIIDTYALESDWVDVNMTPAKDSADVVQNILQRYQDRIEYYKERIKESDGI